MLITDLLTFSLTSSLHYTTCTQCVKWPRKMFGGRKLSSKVDLENKMLRTVVAAVIILDIVNNWRSVLQIHFEKKKLDFEPESPSVTGKVCYHYNSDWCLHGVYISHKFLRKNIRDWVIIWIKFKVLWLL